MFRSVVRKYMKEELAPLQAAFEERASPPREVWRAWASRAPRRGHPGRAGCGHRRQLPGRDDPVRGDVCYASTQAPAIPLHSATVMPYLTHYGTQEQQERIPTHDLGRVHQGASHDGA